MFNLIGSILEKGLSFEGGGGTGENGAKKGNKKMEEMETLSSCPSLLTSVAEPAPALASTTSVPAFWMRSVIAAASASEKETFGVACDSRGRIVVPAWPPTTGTSTSATSRPLASCFFFVNGIQKEGEKERGSFFFFFGRQR